MLDSLAVASALCRRDVSRQANGTSESSIHVPTTDGRELVMTRTTQQQLEVQLLLEKLKLQLPAQPPQKITSAPLASVAAL